MWLLKMTCLKALVQRGEDFASGVSDEHVVFDADAPFAGEIDAGFDRYDHSRAKLFLVAFFSQGGELVDVAADAVAQAVAELFAEAGVFDDLAGDAVGLLRGDAGADELDGRELRVEHDFADLLHARA